MTWQFKKGPRIMWLKNAFLRKKVPNNSGIILIIVLWIMVILSLLAMSLGHRASVDLSLANYSVGKIRSKYIAWAGVNYAMDQMRRSTDEMGSNNCKTQYQCGLTLEEKQTPEDLFKHVKVGEGYFDIFYFVDEENSGAAKRYGFQDEGGRVNINLFSQDRSWIFSQLVQAVGEDQALGASLAAAVIEQRKIKPFESVDELMLVKGMTPELFAKLKDYVTVFPLTGLFQINYDAAPVTVLKAITVPGPKQMLLENLLDTRKGGDGRFATSDDQSLGALDSTMFGGVSRTQSARFLRIRVRGVDRLSHVATEIEAVLDPVQLTVLSWQRK